MSKIKPDQNPHFIETSAVLLSALSNARRLEILTVLLDQEMSVGNLSEHMGLSQSALSQHLAKLRDARLVSFRRDAQTIHYKCDSTAVNKMLTLLSHCFDDNVADLSIAA